MPLTHERRNAERRKRRSRRKANTDERSNGGRTEGASWWQCQEAPVVAAGFAIRVALCAIPAPSVRPLRLGGSVLIFCFVSSVSSVVPPTPARPRWRAA